MASTKQIEANRSNARKSAGPRSAEGKARSSRNALTHGLTAQEIVIPGEDVAAYQQFQQRLIDDLKPNGSCELDLIERFAATCWRLDRIPRSEAAIMAWLEHGDFHQDNDRSPGMFSYNLPLPDEEASHEEEMLDKYTAERWSGRDPYQLKVLGRILEDALTRDAPLLKLNTYEARLIRQSQQLMGQFFALRKARAADLSLGERAVNEALDPSHEPEGLDPSGAVGDKGLEEGPSRH